MIKNLAALFLLVSASLAGAQAPASTGATSPAKPSADQVHRNDDIARHRQMARAHEEAAKCLEAGNPEKQCRNGCARLARASQWDNIVECDTHTEAIHRLSVGIEAQDYGCTPDTSRLAGSVPRGRPGGRSRGGAGPRDRTCARHGPADRPQLLNDLPELKGVVSWKTLGQVKSVQVGKKVVPQFSADVSKLDQQEIRLQGYMLRSRLGRSTRTSC